MILLLYFVKLGWQHHFLLWTFQVRSGLLQIPFLLCNFFATVSAHALKSCFLGLEYLAAEERTFDYDAGAVVMKLWWTYVYVLKKVATDCGSCASWWKLSCDINYRFRVNHYILLNSLPQGSLVIWLLQKGFILLDSLLQGGLH